MDEPPNTPVFPCQHCWRPIVTKKKGYGEHLFVTNPNSIIATFATYIMPFMSQPHFWKSARMTLTLPKWGLGSPLRLPKLQSLITGVKTPYLDAFVMSLESY